MRTRPRRAVGEATATRNSKARDKTSLDVFWLKDKSLIDMDTVPEPDDLAEEIIENLDVGLNSFREVLAGSRQAGSRMCPPLRGRVDSASKPKE